MEKLILLLLLRSFSWGPLVQGCLVSACSIPEPTVGFPDLIPELVLQAYLLRAWRKLNVHQELLELTDSLAVDRTCELYAYPGTRNLWHLADC